MFDAVIFDLFETLVPVFGVGHPSAEENADALGLDRAGFAKQYSEMWRDRQAGAFGSFVDLLKSIANKLGSPVVDPAVAADLTERRSVAFARHLSRVPAEILSMLDALKSDGVAIGLISNTDGTEVADWPNSPLSDYIEVPVFSHLVGVAKPDKAIYEHACRELGHEPESCMYVGDGESDELRGANSVGLNPNCGAWFLLQHRHILGDEVVAERSAGFAVIESPSDVVSAVRRGSRR